MVDFKQLLEERRKEREEQDLKRGWCVLPDPIYLKGTLPGYRDKESHLYPTTIVELTWTIEPSGSRDRNIKTNRIICFKPGVTGWESYYVSDFLESTFWTDLDKGNRWFLCAGGGGYDSLWVEREELQKIKETLEQHGYTL